MYDVCAQYIILSTFEFASVVEEVTETTHRWFFADFSDQAGLPEVPLSETVSNQKKL